MAIKREPEKHANHERWLVSYGDFLTLLFAVFVAMYAMGQTDKKKAEELTQSLRESFGYSTQASAGQKGVLQSHDIKPIPAIKPEMAVIPITDRMPPAGPRQGNVGGGAGSRQMAGEKEFREMASAIEAYLVKQGFQNKVALSITQRGLVISLKEAGFFDSGSAKLKSESIQTLRGIADTLSRYANRFRVEGHTDSMPIRSTEFRSNWELSTARATNVIHFLIDSAGFSPESLSAVGYGEFQPVVDNSTAEQRAKNRRVDIVLLADEAAVGEARPEIMNHR
ncbi:OmpA family protein [Trichlorobacter lovleyi]|uniref:OmpA/MotB domain protein n=1 Tax=Trichlorobacter lovleyi (strain ATCC BAA-1151 / DSM 17278 / SZ) TaxID=398767 RepID=B3E240_TRIL1|nr:OmpA family protein [Trichlorobacter lovleyi]ACD97143.1 OmpA/MotB domain protein [Trichlorobacter lovleyi SZ]